MVIYFTTVAPHLYGHPLSGHLLLVAEHDCNKWPCRGSSAVLLRLLHESSVIVLYFNGLK